MNWQNFENYFQGMEGKAWCKELELQHLLKQSLKYMDVTYAAITYTFQDFFHIRAKREQRQYQYY
jgi:hypothetical protein